MTDDEPEGTIGTDQADSPADPEAAGQTPADGERLSDLLGTVRTDDRKRWSATFVAAFAGIAFASVHWVGLVVGGALVSLPARGMLRGVLAGVAFGALVLLAFVVATPAASPAELLALRPPVFVAIGSGLALPVLGSLVRGVV